MDNSSTCCYSTWNYRSISVYLNILAKHNKIMTPQLLTHVLATGVINQYFVLLRKIRIMWDFHKDFIEISCSITCTNDCANRSYSITTKIDPWSDKMDENWKCLRCVGHSPSNELSWKRISMFWTTSVSHRTCLPKWQEFVVWLLLTRLVVISQCDFRVF